jgi:general secretion pathway protein D
MLPLRPFIATALATALSTTALTLLTASALPAYAQTAAAPSDLVTMNMRDADIRTLIQWIADQTGKNMVVHKDVQGKVNVLSAKPVTKAEAYRVFLSVLQVHGFAAIESPESVKIVPASMAVQSGVPVSANAAASSDMVVQTFKLNNISAVEVAQTVRPLVSKDAVINADAGTNMLLIADHAANVEQLQNIVQRMDRTGGGEVELVQLQHANAKEVVASLSNLYTSQSGAGGQAQGGSMQLTVSADERSNAVLLSGDTSKRAQARRLIKQMDKPLSGEGNTQVVYLQYASAKEVAPILKSIAQSVLKDQKDKASSFSIEPSESANALVINAPPGLIANLRDVVDKLDIQRAQVLVEALIVEVSGDVADDLGVTWVTADLNDTNRTGGVAAGNTLGNFGIANISRDSDGNILDISPGRGITFGYMKDGDLRAAIRALSTTTKANVLSTPTVVAIDNEPASLLVGQNVPFITGQATSAASGTANPFTTIERKDIGISLEVTPRINKGDAITLDIKQKVESIAPSVENATDLVTNKREINTKALIKDNTVLVLGGLISDDETESKEKVPILGDLPLIGKLFSSTGRNRTKKNLMVFIHPVILKDQQHIAEVSKARYDFMRDEQQRAKGGQPSSLQTRNPDSPVLENFETFSKPNRSSGSDSKAAESGAP